MLRFLAFLLLAGFGAFYLSDALERSLIYPFDPTQAPAPAGFTESTLPTGDGNTLIVWSAPPAAGRPTVLYFNGNAGNLAVRTPRFAAFTAVPTLARKSIPL